MAVEERFTSGALTLTGHLAGAGALAQPKPGVVILHGYPSGPGGTAGAFSALPELADRIAEDMGFVAFAPALRGMADSEGDFSVKGWKNDIHAAVTHLRAVARVGAVWLIGFGTGGALAICAGADDETVRGVAALAAPADFDDWASNPRQLQLHARDVGIVADAQATAALLDGWSREMRLTKAVEAAARLRPRPLLVMHGADDDLVPVFDARVLADAHTDAELHVLDGAGHRLRHDPRAMAIVLGWLDRQHNESVLRSL